jgi:hypothetical protein
VPKVGRRETQGASAACRCSSQAQVDRQPGYDVAAIGTEAVRFLSSWMADRSSLPVAATVPRQYVLGMKKFLVLYKASAEAFQQMMKSSTPEQQKAGMEMWMTWSKKAASSIVDMGGPLGKSLRVAKGGAVTPVVNDLGGYSIMQAESKEALAASMKDHPHFMMPESSIEIVELMQIPGM